MTGRRAALGVALKNARRNKKRTFYLVLLIAVPVMVAVMTSVVVAAGYISPEEQATLDFGGTNVKLEQWGGDQEVMTWVHQQIETLAPEAEVLAARAVGTVFGPEVYGQIRDIDLDDPLSEGTLNLIEGRLASAPDEVVLTEHLASVLDARIGDRVALLPEGARRFHVVGLATHPIFWEVNDAILTPEGLDEFVDSDSGDSPQVLIRVDDDVAFTSAFNEAWERNRYDFYPDDREWPMPERYWFLYEGTPR